VIASEDGCICTGNSLVITGVVMLVFGLIIGLVFGYVWGHRIRESTHNGNHARTSGNETEHTQAQMSDDASTSQYDRDYENVSETGSAKQRHGQPASRANYENVEMDMTNPAYTTTERVEHSNVTGTAVEPVPPTYQNVFSSV
ncbi:hypothetical protein LSAT2_010666, partial [Lamellibrachia satsuma]